MYREQIENARENPLAAAAAAAAVTGAAPPPQTQNNVENLLDIDFDGAAPASAQNETSSGMSGLEGLAGTPVRIQSPTTTTAPTTTTSSTPSNNIDDLLGVFDDGGTTGTSGANGNTAGGGDDLLNGHGLSGLDLSGNTGSTTTSTGNQKKTNEDIMSLF